MKVVVAYSMEATPDGKASGYIKILDTETLLRQEYQFSDQPVTVGTEEELLSLVAEEKAVLMEVSP